MNKERRKAIAAAVELIEAARAAVAEAIDAVEAIRDEEQEYYDNMPESFQDGDKGSRAQEAIDYLDNAHSDLEYIDFDSIVSSLESAAE